MNASDQAELLAQGLGISPGSYAGREADAIVAMTLVAGYRRMAPSDQEQLLYRVDGMGLGPAFTAQCRGALALTIVNPLWVPGSLTNGEVEDEISLWRSVSKVLAALGFASGIGTAAGGKARSIFNSVTSGKPVLRGAFTPKNIAGTSAGLMGYAAQSIAQQSIADLSAEATRRGRLGTMTPLHAQLAGGR